jgi:hypothetical protein
MYYGTVDEVVSAQKEIVIDFIIDIILSVFSVSSLLLLS